MSWKLPPRDYWSIGLQALWGVTAAFRAWGAYWRLYAGVALGVPNYVWLAANASGLFALAILGFVRPAPSVSGRPATLGDKLGNVAILAVLSTAATAWAVHEWLGASDSAWLFGAALAAAGWYFTFMTALRAFLPMLADRLRPQRPTRWRVVGDFRLPLSAMFWIDVGAIACGGALSFLGTRFWPVAIFLVLFGVVRLGDRFEVFSDRKA